MFMMRFGMRSRTTDPAARAAMYETSIEMAEWAESRGCLMAVVSEHHASNDGYLPSPVPLAAAMAARTKTLGINVAALLLPLYEPVRIAEDLAIVDLISRGRVSYVVGIGYRDEEFAMFRVDARRRGKIAEAHVRLLQQLWRGETADVDGAAVRITPLPFTPGGPMLAYGGGSEIAARRAARLGLMFLSESHDESLQVAYEEECARTGTAPVGCFFAPRDVPLTVFVADDPDRAWAELGEYMLVDALGYGEWNRHRSGVASISQAQTVAELRAEHGAYQVLTPAEAKALVARGVPLGLQPLVGGIPPEIAWPYLEQAAAVVG